MNTNSKKINWQGSVKPVALSAVAAISLVGCGKSLHMGQKPNVIFIYADDMGKGMVSAYGQKYVQTPNIDRLVQQGVSFSNAYGCMLSAPARASLLTGYHDCRQGKWHISTGGKYLAAFKDESVIAKQEQIVDAADILLPQGDYYLPQVFKNAGYTTAQIGKLEYGFTATRKQMSSHGWDYYYGYLDHVRCHGFYPPFLFENGNVVWIPGNTLQNCGKSMEPETPKAYAERWNREGKAVYSQDLFLEKILQFIRDHKSGPFFLFHPTQLPHGPVSIPKIDSSLEQFAELTSIEKEYASMIKMLDDQIGVIMDELHTLGIARNTVIVFAADNGHEIYYSEAGRCEKPYKNLTTGSLFDNYRDKYYSTLSGDIFNGNASMAGLKRSNLEGGAHIPLTFYWEGKWDTGKVNDQVVAMYDLIPTFAQMLGVTMPVQKDGVSFYPLLNGEDPLKPERYVVFGSYTGPALVAHDHWKIRYYAAAGVYELYNLNDDPRETTNLAAQYPQRLEELKALLLKECAGNINNGICRN